MMIWQAMNGDEMVSQLTNDILFKELIQFHCPTDVIEQDFPPVEITELESNMQVDMFDSPFSDETV